MDNILGMDTCSHIRLTVIIPVYNAEKYLEECLDAILAMSCEDIEVLLVDDGCTDASGAICDRYSKTDTRFFVYHKPNGGVSSARNFALEKAHGKWVTFVDADDIPTDSLIEFQTDDSDLICFNWRYTTGETENELLENANFLCDDKLAFLNSHLVDFVFRTPWAKIFRRSVIEDNAIRFDERFRLGEDNLFMLDYLAHCGGISTRREFGYVYLRPLQTKYSLPLSDSVAFITVFMQKYQALGVDCQPLLLLLEYYYFIKVGDDSLKVRLKWERCRAVRELKNICWRSYSVKEQMKITFMRICGSIVYGKN